VRITPQNKISSPSISRKNKTNNDYPPVFFFFPKKKKLPTGNDNEKEKKSVEFEKFHQK